MKALKVLVIGMALLLIAGLGLVGYGIYRNSVKPTAAAIRSPAPMTAVEAGSRSYFSVELPLPVGAKLEQMATVGDRLVLRLTGEESGERILVVDPATGQVAGTISLVPQSR